MQFDERIKSVLKSEVDDVELERDILDWVMADARYTDPTPRLSKSHIRRNTVGIRSPLGDSIRRSGCGNRGLSSGLSTQVETFPKQCNLIGGLRPQKFFFAQNFNTEFLSLLQLRSGFLPSDQIISL